MKTSSLVGPRTTTSKKRNAAVTGGERRRRITSILAPVDFSEASKQGLSYAAALAEEFGAKITLLYVVELADIVGVFQLLLDDDEIIATCKGKLLKFARKASVPTQLIANALVRKGRAYREISQAARTLKVDLIVISTHGYTEVTHAMMGSVAERVVRDAPCPVLVVREQRHDGE